MHCGRFVFLLVGLVALPASVARTDVRVSGNTLVRASRSSSSGSSRMVLAQTPAVGQPTFNLPTPQGLASWYREASRAHHLEMAFTQSGLLGATADAVSQQMHGVAMDSSHILAMGILGAFLSGLMNAQWLKLLEEAVPGSDDRAVLTKTAADYCIAGVLANSAFLVTVPILTALLSGVPLAEALATNGWTPESFRAVMLIEACTFGPYNLCAFRLVPPRLRPLSAATVSATCAIALSGITLGFGL